MLFLFENGLCFINVFEYVFAISFQDSELKNVNEKLFADKKEVEEKLAIAEDEIKKHRWGKQYIQVNLTS